MNEIEESNAVERTMTVQSGVVLEAVQNAAEDVGLMYPLDIGGAARAPSRQQSPQRRPGNRVIRYAA